MTAATPDSSRSSSLLAWLPDAEASAARSAAEAADHDLTLTGAVEDGFRRLGAGSWTVVLVSFSLPGVDEAVVRRISEAAAPATVLLSTRGASLERAMIMERTGAAALLREPLDAERLAEELRSASRGGGTVVSLPEPPEADDARPAIVGSSPEMAKVFETVARVADADATVLITGESGTGKELVARALHRGGRRSGEPFVPVNCAALPEHLLESELFGHERGAFTGAVARKRGRFERADGGTLFLDEIGDMSLPLQARNLRALKDRVIELVGGEDPIPHDVRVLAATNRPLDDRLGKGAFREDLYYRLAVIELEMPPLRERTGDVPELALHFAATFGASHDRPLRGMTEEALRRLEGYPWPGNVRELRNVIDRAVLLATGEVIRSRDLRLGSASPRGSSRERGAAPGYAPTRSLEEVEAAHIQQVLRYTGGHMGDAADLLGIHRNTLTRKVRDHDLDVPDGRSSG